MSIEELAAAALAEVEGWKAQALARITAEHNAEMRAIRERAKVDLDLGLAQLLVQYQLSLETVGANKRRIAEKYGAEVVSGMETTFERDRAAAKRMFDHGCRTLRTLYRDLLDVE